MITAQRFAAFYLACLAEKYATVVQLKLTVAIVAHTIAASRSPAKKSAASAEITGNPDKPNATGVRILRIRSCRASLALRLSLLAAIAASNACVPSIAVSSCRAL